MPIIVRHRPGLVPPIKTQILSLWMQGDPAFCTSAGRWAVTWVAALGLVPGPNHKSRGEIAAFAFDRRWFTVAVRRDFVGPDFADRDFAGPEIAVAGNPPRLAGRLASIEPVASFPATIFLGSLYRRYAS